MIRSIRGEHAFLRKQRSTQKKEACSGDVKHRVHYLVRSSGMISC